MTDIVKQLRAVDQMSIEDCFGQSPLYVKAADEIDRLRALLAEAREVKSLVSTRRVDQIVGTADPTEDEAHDMAVELMNWRRAARAIAEKLKKETGND